MKKSRRFFLVFSIVFVFCFLPWLEASYFDQVAIPQGEIWQAAYRVLEPYGIKKADPVKGVIETKWVEDKVRRSKTGFFHDILKQQYFRRYRLKLSLKEAMGLTDVQLRGSFQIRSTSGPMTAWRTTKTTGVDHQLEREVFFKILTQIENSRKNPPGTSSS